MSDAELFGALGDKLDAIEAAITAETGKREEEIIAANDTAAAATEAASLSRRKAHRATVFAVIAVFVGIIGIVSGRLAQATADDIIAARKDGRAAVCDEVSALVNALIASSPPSSDPAAAQARADAFAADLQARSGPLGCKFHFTIRGG